MKLTLYKCNDDERTLNKTLQGGREFEGTIKDGGNVLRPFFLAKGDVTEIIGYNYAQIEAFNRYYYIAGVTVLTNSIVSISLEIDVLMSYKDALLKCSGRVVKSENPEAYKLQKELKDTNTTKQIVFNNPFNFDGVNVMVCVNGNRAN